MANRAYKADMTLARFDRVLDINTIMDILLGAHLDPNGTIVGEKGRSPAKNCSLVMSCQQYPMQPQNTKTLSHTCKCMRREHASCSSNCQAPTKAGARHQHHNPSLHDRHFVTWSLRFLLIFHSWTCFSLKIILTFVIFGRKLGDEDEHSILFRTSRPHRLYSGCTRKFT